VGQVLTNLPAAKGFRKLPVSTTRSVKWALALWRHSDSPDGILYRSKRDPNHMCAAIFGRYHCDFAVATTTPLMDIPHHWAPILGAHGKGIA
jgi:hypothetical protein